MANENPVNEQGERCSFSKTSELSLITATLCVVPIGRSSCHTGRLAHDAQGQITLLSFEVLVCLSEAINVSRM